MPSADKRARQKENTRLAREARENALKRKRRNRTILSAGAVALVLILFVVLLNIIKGDDNSKKSTTTTTPTTTATSKTTTPKVSKPVVALDPTKDYTATIKTNFGDIVIALDTKNAPTAASQFIKLAKSGFYDKLTWHRASKNFVIQGGDPKGDGSGGSGTSVVGEVPQDHYPVGALAAAKTGADPPGTFDSQFFIVTGANGATLPNDYARFGMVTKGIENAQKIEALAPASGDGPPTAPATIDKVTIDETPAASTATTSGAATTPTT